MTYFEVKNGHVLKRPEKGVGIDEDYIVDPSHSPVADRILDLCAHYNIHRVACDPDQDSGNFSLGPLVVSWDGDDLGLYLPDTGFRNEIDRESAADDVTSWLEVAEELERLFKGFDDLTALGPLALSVTFDGKKIGVLVYQGPAIMAKYTSESTGYLITHEAPLSDQLDDWGETLLANLRETDTHSISQISLREDYEALYLKGWLLSVNEGDLPDEFPGRPALRAVRQGFADLVREIDPKEAP